MIEVLKQALDALEEVQEFMNTSDWFNDKVTSLRQAIAQLERQEPVAYLCENAVGHKYFRWKKPTSIYKPIALYTHPPQRTWVGLTDEEHCDIWYKESLDWMEYGKAIEAKLKEKNT